MLKFISAEERINKKSKVKIVLFGTAGVGKTFQARTLDPKTTLFLDLESGTLALGEWPGTVFDIRANANAMGVHSWELARAIACVISGPDPSTKNGAYSQSMYNSYVDSIGGPEQFAQYNTIFIDSITVAGRQCFRWAETQPAAFSEKTGKPDKRGAYGLMGQEMVDWLTILQHAPKNIILVGLLNSEKDEFNRYHWVPQIDGNKTANELPGIFDQIMTLDDFETADKQPYKAFVTHKQNPQGYPAKDRSGCLEMYEKPHLGELIAKIEAGKRIDQLVTTIPKEKPTQPETPKTKDK